MSRDYEEFWSVLPENVLHPLRVPVVESLWRIGEPLSSIDLVDVLDGHITMWEAAHHLRVLDALDVVEPDPAGRDSLPTGEIFNLPYHLRAHDVAGEG
jgi:hypothetical protein